MCYLAEQKLHTNNCTAQLFLTILLCAVQVGLGPVKSLSLMVYLDIYVQVWCALYVSWTCFMMCCLLCAVAPGSFKT